MRADDLTRADDAGEVARLVYLYAERLDGGDLDGVAALFARATWRSDARPDQPLRGQDEVRRVYDRVLLYDGLPSTRHVISNLVVDVAGNGHEASSRSYFTVFQARPDLPLQAIISGRYHDQFARTDGEWHFTDRLIITDLTGDLSRHYPR